MSREVAPEHSVVDVRALPRPKDDSHMAATLAELAAQPFVLSRGCLLRVCVFESAVHELNSLGARCLSVALAVYSRSEPRIWPTQDTKRREGRSVLARRGVSRPLPLPFQQVTLAATPWTMRRRRTRARASYSL